MLGRRMAAFAGVVALAIATAGDARAEAAKASDGRTMLRAYRREDGLDAAVVECLLQDREGFLWVGTPLGLYRYDGRRFERFGLAEGLPHASITALHQTRDGRLFVGTEAGLARRAGDHFIALTSSAGLPAETIPYEGIASDDAGLVYVGTRRGLFSSRDDTFALIPRGDGKKETTTYGMHVDPSGALIYASEALLRRKDGRTEDFGAAHGLGLGPTDWMDWTLTDSHGNLWVRTVRALYVLRAGEAMFRRDDEGLAGAMDSGRLALDDRGEVMVPTLRGVARKDPTTGRWTVVGSDAGLEAEATTSAIVDREGSLWIGTFGGGVVRRVGRGAITWQSHVDGLSHDVVSSLARDATGRLWVGTPMGLDRSDGDGWVHEPEPRDVRALALDDDGSVWAGQWSGGVVHVDPKKGLSRAYGARDPSEALHVLCARLFAGAVWVGTWNGAYRLAPGADAFERVRVDPVEEPDTIYALTTDGAGSLFAGTRAGLVRLEGGARRRFRRGDGLHGDAVTSLARAADGAILVGYDGDAGIDRVVASAEAIAVTPFFQGDPTTRPLAIAGLDASGAVWISTRSGMDVVGRDGALRAHLGDGDGLPSELTGRDTFVADADGAVLFGSARGLVRYDPRATPQPRPAPIVTIVRAWAGDRALSLEGPTRLSSSDNRVRIEWAAPTFVEREKVRFHYRLVGLDDAESETTLDEARFSSLPAGHYRLEVRATSALGVASLAPATFTFDVERPWFDRAWARLGALVGALGLVGAVVRWRTHALERDRRRLEDAVAERSEELAALNRELEQLSFTDALTRLKNRRFLANVIGAMSARALANHVDGERRGITRNRDLVFHLIDIDHFKAINDQHGHAVGDAVLVEVGRRLMSVARKSDLVVRWGGEEFLVVSPDAERAFGEVLSQRSLRAMSDTPIDLPGKASLSITCSIGWAAFPIFTKAPRSLGYEEVIAVADAALYLAKRRGRNRSIGVPVLDASTPVDGDADTILADVGELGTIPLKIVTTEGEGRASVMPASMRR